MTLKEQSTETQDRRRWREREEEQTQNGKETKLHSVLLLKYTLVEKCCVSVNVFACVLTHQRDLPKVTFCQSHALRKEN